MNNGIQKKIRSVVRESREKRRWKRIAVSLCAVVAIGTAYALSNPASTQTAQTFCGMEEHEHTDACYEKKLICELPEEAHHHDESCLGEIRTLTCTLTETDGHTHTVECCAVEDVIVCGLEETEGHTHTEEQCYGTYPVLICTLPETDGHTHTDACRVEQTSLVCPLAETPGHTHGDACYADLPVTVCTNEDPEHVHGEECVQMVRTLICTLPECEPHTHTDECYASNTVVACTLPECEPHHHGEGCCVNEWGLICTLPECEPHHHGESCHEQRQVTVCGLEECEAHHHDDTCYTVETGYVCGKEECEAHEHTDECYAVDKDVLICEKPEHKHTLQCFSDPEADLETAEQWESTFAHVELTGNWAEDVLNIAGTQIGYAESQRNYFVLPDGTTMNGYTRYGARYLNPYGNWSAMFCSFCLNYAGVSEEAMPVSADVSEWLTALRERGMYQPAGSGYVPKPGDLIFFDTDEDDAADHMGFVKEILDGGNGEPLTFNTIEGDKFNAVYCDQYSSDREEILGFGPLPENTLPVSAEPEVRTVESEGAADGAVVAVTGALPEGAAVTIESLELTPEDMIACFGEEKANGMDDYAAYDISVLLGEEKWQPEGPVSVTLKGSPISGAGPVMAAHINAETNAAEPISAAVNAEGALTFSTESFSEFIFYKYTLNFSCDEGTSSLPGGGEILLSGLLGSLGIERGTEGIESVTFSDPSVLRADAAEGDWNLVSIEPFSSEKTLTVLFDDGEERNISVRTGEMIPLMLSAPVRLLAGASGNSAEQYLKTSAANSWQIVDKGYAGNTQSAKIMVDNDGDGKAELYIQKNVIPTDTENEFYVYLSMDTQTTMRELLDKSLIIAKNNMSSPAGTFTTKLNGQVTNINEHGVGGSHSYPVTILVYEYMGGPLLYTYSDTRYGDAPNCSNGAVLMQLPGRTDYLSVQDGVDFHQDSNSHPMQLYLYLNEYSITDLTKSCMFSSVVDVVGDYITDVNVADGYCDGSVSYDSGTRTVTWLPQRNPDVVPEITINPINGWDHNVAQLVYKVTLDVEKAGFNSCADNMNSTKNQPESYKVNESAVVNYNMAPLPGATGTESPDYTGTFPVPYVRGLLYDVYLNKTEETGKPLKDAGFKIRDSEGNYVKSASGEDLTAWTDEAGKLRFVNLPWGTYTLEEFSPPFGYKKTEITTTLCYTTNKTGYEQDNPDYPDNMRPKIALSLMDELLPGWKVRMKKIDSRDAELPVQGATFDLYNTDPKGEGVTPVKTDLVSGAGGIFSPEGDLYIPYGTYYLVETEAAPDYKLLEEPFVFTVSENGVSGAELLDGGTYLLTVENEKDRLILSVAKDVPGINECPVRFSFRLTVMDAEGAPADMSEFLPDLQEKYPENSISGGSDGAVKNVILFDLAETDDPLEFPVIPSGGKAELRETKHDGYYVLFKEDPVVLTNGELCVLDEIIENRSLTVINTAGSELPHTGGSGVFFIYTFGILLLAGSAMCIFRRGRKAERGD